MILLLIILLSLSAVYFTRLLQRKGMKTASVMVAVLYLYLIAWIYAVFILDIADLGFAETETRISLLHGSNIYHLFVQLNAQMSLIPLPLLEVIAGVAAFVVLAGIAVALHGVVEITRVICRFAKERKYEFANNTAWETAKYRVPAKAVSILRLNCRANC